MKQSNNFIVPMIEALQQGKVVLYDTDTIPGLGCDARSETAIQLIISIKKRSLDKWLIVLVSDFGMLERFWKKEHDYDSKYRMLKDLYETATKPTTFVIPSQWLSPLLTKDGNSAIRIISPKHPLADIIRQLGHPIVSTSANISGEVSPHCMADVDESIKDVVPLYEFGIGTGSSSRLISLLGDDPVVLRE